jgi:RNA polymerase sigma factor (sigma-70 family)
MGDRLTLPEFNILVERFYPDLTKRAVRLCRDYTVAEDAVQNTLLFAFEKFEQFEKLDQKAYDIQFRAWLYKMLSNMIYYMFSRRSGASKPNYQKYAYASFVYFNDRNMRSFSGIDCSAMFGKTSQESETDYIMKVINELPLGFPHGITGRVVPSRYQEIAKMAFIDGLTAPEIGTLLGLADATIRSRISHIRQILKEKLAPVMQLADISVSKTESCRFESDPEYQN